MRLHPPVSVEEAEAWLKQEVTGLVGDQPSPAITAEIRSLAETLSAISHFDIPQEIEPRFP
jgi:hypothetical protein